MSRRTSIAATTALVAGALTSAALAATAAKDPKLLVLRASDLPAGAVAGPSFKVPNGTFGARDYYVVINYGSGMTEREATSEAAVSKNAADAANGFKRMAAAYTGLPGSTPLKLPAYGDDQRAEFVSTPTVARGTLIVRKNAVVWRLAIESCGPYSPAGCLHGRTPPKLTMAQALAELKKYAPKQRTHIGG